MCKKSVLTSKKSFQSIRCVIGLFWSSTISVDNPGDNGFVVREMGHTE